MTELEEGIIREHNYNEYRNRMKAVKNSFKAYRIFNVYFNIAVTVGSAAYIYLWLCYTNAGIRYNQQLDEAISAITFPGEAVTAFLTPFILIISFISDVFLVKKLNIAAQILYLIIGAFSLLNMVFGFEPMELSDMIFLIVYSVLGIFFQDKAIRCYKELDFLSDKEGYPDFNYSIECERHSKYVKYRTRWLKKEKQLDYFTDNERPVEEYEVIRSDKDNGMDGVSVTDQVREQWFDDSKKVIEATDSNDHMGVITSEQITLDTTEDDYVIDDVRRKPL